MEAFAVQADPLGTLLALIRFLRTGRVGPFLVLLRNLNLIPALLETLAQGRLGDAEQAGGEGLVA